VHAASFSPDGERLASVSLGREAIKLWDVKTRHEVATLSAETGFFDRITFSPDGQIIIAINARGEAYVCRWRRSMPKSLT
jgi:WD40 repeat protein